MSKETGGCLSNLHVTYCLASTLVSVYFQRVDSLSYLEQGNERERGMTEKRAEDTKTKPARKTFVCLDLFYGRNEMTSCQRKIFSCADLIGSKENIVPLQSVGWFKLRKWVVFQIE